MLDQLRRVEVGRPPSARRRGATVESAGLACYAHQVLTRVMVITLGAALLVATGYLVVQVGADPSEVVAHPASPHARHGRLAPLASSADAPGGLAAPSQAFEAVGTSSEEGGPARASATPAAANLAFDEANKLYDRHDYEEARSLALTLLGQHPSSVRMRRVVVASSCIMGDLDTAQQHYLLLPERDRADMRQRCVQYGLSFHE